MTEHPETRSTHWAGAPDDSGSDHPDCTCSWFEDTRILDIHCPIHGNHR